MAKEDVLYKKEGNLAIITLNRPEVLNAFSPDMSRGIVEAVEDIERDEKVKVAILTGTGDRAFSAGGDVRGMNTRIQGGASGVPAVAEWVGRKYTSLCLYECAKPLFAAVNGVAVGGGLGLSLACDLRIASEKARFGAVFVRRGLIDDDGVSWHLPRLLGVPKALELMLTGDIIDAQEALRIGLVSKVVPPEKLMETTKELAERIAKGPTIAQMLIKRTVRRTFENNLAEQMDLEYFFQGRVSQTEDHKEGVRAFLERRDANFKGR